MARRSARQWLVMHRPGSCCEGSVFRVPSPPIIMRHAFTDRRTLFLVVVASLGYFVDIYDLVLFNVDATTKAIAVNQVFVDGERVYHSR